MTFQEISNKRKKEIQLLEKHGWKFSDNCILNSVTGCQFQILDFMEDFIIEKFNELNEEEPSPFNQNLFNDFLKNYGYEIISESPLEILKNDKELNTGECANFIYNSLKETFLKSNYKN